MEAASPDPLREIATRDPRARGLLATLSFLAPRPIPLELVEAALPGASLAERQTAVRTLVSSGAATLGEGHLFLSGEIAEAARAALGQESYYGALLACDLLLAAFPADPADPAEWPLAARLLPQLELIDDLRGALGGPPPTTLLARGADYLLARGELPRAEELAKHAGAAVSVEAAPEHLALVQATLGRVLAARGYLREAAQQLTEARETWAGLQGAGGEGFRTATVALAGVEGELGLLEEALSLAHEAAAPDSEDRLGLAGRRRIAWVAMERGELGEAQQIYEAAAVETAALLGPGHPEAIEATGDLGGCLVERAEWGPATARLEEALRSGLEVLGARHPLLGVIRSNLATALEGVEELPRARAEAQEALAIGEERLPPAHRSLWLRRRKLRRILRSLGDPIGAREHAAAAARLSEEVLGSAHPEHALDLFALGEMLLEADELADGIESLEEAVEVLVAAGPGYLPQLADARTRLGGAFASAGEPSQARQILEAAMGDFASLADGEGSVAVRAALAELLAELGSEEALTLELLGHHEAAEEARRRSIEAAEASLGGLLGDLGEPGECFALAKATRRRWPRVAREALGRAAAFADAEEEPETAAVAARAVGLAWQAYGRARLELDSGDAAAALDQARALLAPRPDEEAAVLFDLAGLAAASKDGEHSEQLFAAAADRFEEAGAQFDRGSVLLAWGRARLRRGDQTGAADLFRERLRLLGALPEPEPRAVGITWHDLGTALWDRGEREPALEAWRAAEVAKREAGSADELALTLVVIGDALTIEGEREGALGHFEEALGLVRSMARPVRPDEERVLLRIGDIHGETGEHARAAGAFADAAALARLHGEQRHLAVVLLRLGRALQADEDLAGAEEAYRERLMILRGLEVREPRAEGIALHDLGEVLRARGSLAEAAATLREAAVSAREAGEIDGAAFSMLSAARADQEAEDLGAAEEAFAERLGLLRELPERRPVEEGVALRELADLADTRGDVEEALGLYGKAIAALREVPSPPPGPLAGALIGSAMVRVRLSTPPFEDPTGAILDPGAAPSVTRAWIDAEAAAPVLAELREAEALAAPEPMLDPLSLAGLRTAVVVAAECLPGAPEELEVRDAAEASVAAVIEGSATVEGPEELSKAVVLAAELARFDLVDTGLDRLAETGAVDDLDGEPLAAKIVRLGRLAERAGEPAEAKALYQRALELIRSRPEPDRIAEGVALGALAAVARRRGQLAEAAERYREAAEVRGDAGRAAGEGMAFWWLALVLRAMGKKNAAAEGAARALKRLREAEKVAAVWLVRALVVSGSLADDSSREEAWAEAEALLDGEEIDEAEAKRLREVLEAIREGRVDPLPPMAA